MKVKYEVELYVPNSLYCGDCCYQEKEEVRGCSYCALFHWALIEAKDRPQFIKCEECLRQLRKNV